MSCPLSVGTQNSFLCPGALITDPSFEGISKGSQALATREMKAVNVIIRAVVCILA